jgi:hypothetical protein
MGTYFRYMQCLSYVGTDRLQLIAEVDAYIEWLSERDGLAAALFSVNAKVATLEKLPEPISYQEFKAHPEIYS